MKNNKVVIDNKNYLFISDVFVEDSHYYLANQLDDNLVSIENYVFVLEVEDESTTYEIVEDDEIKSILAKIFLPIIDKM